ncbi:carbohydrate kinase family protein [Pokkaliibacter sp. CJK22405]|uniref:carbohydrate kinase family protein n=1 Tax=Pokkaliibacter sp. CJK22405 TaxID=3384615 RepID=UPI003984D417
MWPVWCFGEVLIDFLNIGATEEAGLSLAELRQYPGGAPANAAVAVAQLGGKAGFIGQVGDDAFGHFLLDALQKKGVDTSRTVIHPDAPTPLAFVLLDENGERSFEFMRRNSADVLFRPDQFKAEWFQGEGIMHLCSNTLTEESIANTTLHGVKLARDAGWWVTVDVNLRANLWPNKLVDTQRVDALCKLAHVIKISREELNVMGGEAMLPLWLAAGVKLIVVSDDGNPLYFATRDHSGWVDAPKVKVVDTNAAGDSFSGAMLYTLSRCLPNNPQLLDDEGSLRALVSFAAACGSHTVQRRGAFPALPGFADVAEAWTLEG